MRILTITCCSLLVFVSVAAAQGTNPFDPPAKSNSNPFGGGRGGGNPFGLAKPVAKSTVKPKSKTPPPKSRELTSAQERKRQEFEKRRAEIKAQEKQVLETLAKANGGRIPSYMHREILRAYAQMQELHDKLVRSEARAEHIETRLKQERDMTRAEMNHRTVDAEKKFQRYEEQLKLLGHRLSAAERDNRPERHALIHLLSGLQSSNSELQMFALKYFDVNGNGGLGRLTTAERQQYMESVEAYYPRVAELAKSKSPQVAAMARKVLMQAGPTTAIRYGVKVATTAPWPIVQQPGNQQEQLTLDKLDLPVAVDFYETPLRDCLEYLGELTNVKLHADADELDNVAIALDEPVTLQLKKVSLRSALKMILKRMSATYQVRNNVIVITSVDDADAHPRRRMYDISSLTTAKLTATDIKAAVEGLDGAQEDKAKKTAAKKQAINNSSQVRLLGDKLLVSGPEQLHYECGKLLRLLSVKSSQ